LLSPFEWFVGLRYTRSGKRAGKKNGFISFISALSVAGIALGVAALIIVMSVMNGFQKEVRDRMLSVLSHVEVYHVDGPLNWQPLAEKLRGHDHVTGAAPFVSGQVVISRNQTVRGALVRGKVELVGAPREDDYFEAMVIQKDEQIDLVLKLSIEGRKGNTLEEAIAHMPDFRMDFIYQETGRIPAHYSKQILKITGAEIAALAGVALVQEGGRKNG